MESTVVTTKGQIVIPVKLRKIFGIKRGTRVFLEKSARSIIIHPATQSFYQKTFGILKGSGVLKMLKKSRLKEKMNEKSNI